MSKRVRKTSKILVAKSVRKTASGVVGKSGDQVRSAAKNHRFVGVVTDPADYDRVAREIEQLEGRL